MMKLQTTVNCLLPQVYNRAIKPKYMIFWRFLEASILVECIDDIFIAKGPSDYQKNQIFLKIWT